MGLQNPGGTGSLQPDITGGWVRATDDQNPYVYSGTVPQYVFAYWDTPNTVPPNTNFAKASVLLVARNGNPNQGNKFIHSWDNFLRWGYSTHVPVTISGGQTITQRYLLQLGTEGSLFLPDIKTSTVADPIAAAYQADSLDESGGGSGIPTGSFGYKLVMG